MKKIKRDVNKKFAKALIACRGLNHERLGQLCDPPVSRAAISFLLLGRSGGERLQGQVTEILRPAVNEMTSELERLHNADLFDALFPPVCPHPVSVGPPITEGNHSTLHDERGHHVKNKTGA